MIRHSISTFHLNATPTHTHLVFRQKRNAREESKDWRHRLAARTPATDATIRFSTRSTASLTCLHWRGRAKL